MTRADSEIELEFCVQQGKLIEYRRKLGRITQQGLAVEIGVHRNAVSRWEEGTHAVPLWMLLRIADVLHCNHLVLLPPRAYTWGSDLALAARERDPLNGLRYERDPKLSAEERAQ